MRGVAGSVVALLALTAPVSADDAVSTDDAALVRHRNELGAIRGLETLSAAQSLFREGDKDANGEYDYADSLAALGKPKLISVEFAQGTLSGYRFVIRRHPKQPEFQWMVTATPITPTPGARSFALNHTGQILHALKPFALQDDCQPTGVVLRSPLAGWSAPTTALGTLFKTVGPALTKRHRRGFNTYLVPGDKSSVTYSEVQFRAAPLRVETYLVEKGGITTIRRFHLSPEGFLVYAAILRGKLTDRKRPAPTWELKPSGDGFAVTHAGKTTPFAASPRALPRDVLIHLLPHLLLESKGKAFSAPLLTLDLKNGFGAPKGDARLALDASAKRVGGSPTEAAYQFSHSTRPGATVWIATTGPEQHTVEELHTGTQQLSSVPQSKGVGILKSFLPKGTMNKTREVAAARAQLNALKAALANYSSDMGRYPRLTPRPAAPPSYEAALADDAPALFAALLNLPTLQLGGGQNSPYLDGWKRIGVLSSRSYLGAAKIGGGAKPLSAKKRKRLNHYEVQSVHVPSSPNPLVLLDPWGNPYHYREWASCRTSVKRAMVLTPAKRTVTVAGKAKIISDRPHNLERFDIWSNGPNGINEYGAPGSDDVVSWRP